MLKVRPYVSLDVETTGLDPVNDTLLSIGMVFDDGRPDTKIDMMPKVHLGIRLDEMPPGNDYALNLNKDLISYLMGNVENNEAHDILRKDLQVGSKGDTLGEVMHFIDHANKIVKDWDEANGVDRPENIQLLTKNGEKLDIPFMTNFFANGTTVKTDWFRNLISHRGMDVGPMYVPRYGKNVSLSQINKDLGIRPVTHNALQDAIDNVKALRELMFS
jgi:hypothetical protein